MGDIGAEWLADYRGPRIWCESVWCANWLRASHPNRGVDVVGFSGGGIEELCAACECARVRKEVGGECVEPSAA